MAPNATERRAFEAALAHFAKGNTARAVTALPRTDQPEAEVLLRAHLEERQGEEDPAVVTRVSVLLAVMADISAAYRNLPPGGPKACLHRAAHMILDFVGPPVGVPRPHARVRPGFYRQEKP